MSLVKAMATVAGLTGVSRIAGFIRDILTATVLGAGPVADAFFVALKLPNFFRRVTAEGAFSVSFVPMYTKALEKDGEEQATLFANEALSMMLWLLSGFTIFVMLAMPFVIYLIAPGFHNDPVRYDLAIDLSRVTFPYLLMMSLTALLGGVLNAHDRFGPFAAAPIIFNLTLITFLLCAGFGFETPGHALSWGVLLAGFLQFALLFISAKRIGFKLKLRRPQFNVRTKQLFKLMGPGVIGAGVVHINLFADVIIASLLETGSISYLYYADRLNQLPLGIVGIAVGTALLPMLSRAMTSRDSAEVRGLFNRALEACFLLGLPAAIGLLVIAHPIVTTLFEHGAFDARAAAMTSAVVTAYALGLPAYIAVKVYSTAYWAKQDTLTPVKASVIATLFNITLSLWLVFKTPAGVVGIAAATSMAGWLQIMLLSRGLKGREDVRLDDRFKKNLLRIVLGCFLMGSFLYVTKGQLQDFYRGDAADLGSQILALVILIGGGMAVYGLTVTMTGVIKIKDIKGYLKK